MKLNKILLVFYKTKNKLFPKLFNNADMLRLLRINGIKVGNNTKFYNPGLSSIDITRPCLLEIGNYCKITEGVIILTHDYSRSVLRRMYGDIIGEARKTVIGNNVFIGMNSIILMGTQIGNNVIIGAGSVVSGMIPDNVVVAGNPAKVVKTLGEHYEKRKKQYVIEALDYVNYFIDFYHRIPTIHETDPFYPLYLQRDKKLLTENQLSVKLGGDDYHDVLNCYLKSTPVFDGYEQFIEAAIQKKVKE